MRLQPSAAASLRELALHVNRSVLGLGSDFRLRVTLQAASIVAIVEPEGHPEVAYVIKMRAREKAGGRHDEWAEALRYEFENLRRLHEARAGFRVPAPLYLDCDRSAIAMTRLSGRPVARRHRVKGRLGTPFDRGLRRDLERAGAALRALHGLEADAVPASPESILGRLRRNLEHPSLGAAGSERARLSRATDELARYLTDPDGHVLCHHDFTLHNILVGKGDEIGLVDLDGMARNRPEADLSTLWLSVAEWLAIVPGERRRRRRTERLWASFAWEYGVAPDLTGLWPFLVWRLVNRIVALASETDRHRRAREWHRRRLVSVHRMHLRRVLEAR